jgi:alpha-D-ribose 1-methylphosphonate 5-triphosphate synthase subunit PhnH
VTSLASNPVFENQAAFRAVMDAFAAPGSVKTVSDASSPAPPAPLAPATGAIVRSLADFETPIWLDPALAVPVVMDWVRFQTGAPIVDGKQAANFALIGDTASLTDFSGFSIGTADYPDRSCTLLLQVDSLVASEGLTLTGPGIECARRLRIDPLASGFVQRWEQNRGNFPCGVDIILVAGSRIAALPRSVRIAEGS